MFSEMFGDMSSVIVPLAIFAIPIVAIVGGITAGIVKTVAEGRIVENAQKERIAAIQAGIDPTKLPPIPGRASSDIDVGLLHTAVTAPPGATFDYVAQRRAWGLLVGGLVCTFVGLGLGAFLYFVNDGESHAWAVGLIPGSVGLALLLSWVLVRPHPAK